jgi:hypothetical protein
MPYNPFSLTGIAPESVIMSSSTGYGDISLMILDGTTEKLGFRFFASGASAITHVNVRLNIVGTPGSFRTGIFTDDGTGNTPNAQVGDWTGTWAAPGADGMSGAQALATDTGDLTPGAAYWVVIEYVSGTLDGSNYIQLQRLANVGASLSMVLCRHHNGTNWTTTTSQTATPIFTLTHADGDLTGYLAGQSASISNSSATAIYGSNREALRFRSGAQMRVYGCLFMIDKVGTPTSGLVISVYEGDTLKSTITHAAGFVADSSGSTFPALFDDPPLLSADTDLFIVFEHESAGGSGSQYYRLWVTRCISEAEVELLAGEHWKMVYGSGNPSTMTPVTTEIPFVTLLTKLPAEGFDQARVSPRTRPLRRA